MTAALSSVTEAPTPPLASFRPAPPAPPVASARAVASDTLVPVPTAFAVACTLPGVTLLSAIPPAPAVSPAPLVAPPAPAWMKALAAAVRPVEVAVPLAVPPCTPFTPTEAPLLPP